MCAAAFSAIQNFPKDTAVKLTDTYTTPGVSRKSIRSVPGEGKHVADGYGGQPQNVLKKHARSDDAQLASKTYGGGCRNMALFVASQLLKGTRKDLYTRGRWSVDNYFHFVYDETTGFDQKLAAPTDTWVNSDSFSVFWSDEVKGCGRRWKDCLCTPCLDGRFWNCLMKEYDSGLYYGGASYKHLKPKKPTRKRPPTRNNPTSPENMALALVCIKNVNGNLGSNTKRVVATRCDPGDSSGHGEMYKLVKPIKKAWKALGRCTVAGVTVAKGTYLFEVEHYQHLRTDPGSGERVYSLLNGPAPNYIMPLVCVVHNLSDISFAEVRRSDDKVNEFVLSTETHEKLMTAGDLVAE